MLEKGVGGSKYKLEYCLDSAERFRFCIMATFNLKRLMFIFLEGMGSVVVDLFWRRNFGYYLSLELESSYKTCQGFIYLFFIYTNAAKKKIRVVKFECGWKLEGMRFRGKSCS